MTTFHIVLLGIAGIMGYLAYQRFLLARENHERWTRGLGAAEVGLADLVEMAGAASAQVGSGAFRRVVTLTGVAEGETRAAPLSGADCLWFRERTLRRYRGDKGTETEIVGDRRGGTRFTLRDGDAVVTVDPVDARMDLPVAERREEGPDPDEGIDLGLLRIGSGTQGYERTEWRIEPGERITVVGEARCAAGGVRVAAGPEQPLTLTTADRSDHLDAERRRSRDAIRSAAGLGAGAVVLAVLAFLV
ncbi:GIDE domain-containing protein [Pseudonocardia sp. NPDC046786]|uniref:GIDE domain-containing protein n=1 Tax=Pseudonocardia sp. NPDC046786 TaxID=3155471 RepID=UPI00340B8CD8